MRGDHSKPRNSKPKGDLRRSDVSEKSEKNRKRILREFMSFLHKCQYDKDKEFTLDELMDITALDVRQWFCSLAYGKIEPEPGDMSIIKYNSFLRLKTHLSNSMPEHHLAWDPEHKTGNPTRSYEVNNLLNQIMNQHLNPVRETAENEIQGESGDESVEDEEENAEESSEIVENKDTPQFQNFHRCLRQFMSFLHGKPEDYPEGHEFTVDELAAVTPSDICRWFRHKAFGELGDRPLPGKSASIFYYKNAISFFMPDKETEWDPEQKKGDPTKSKEVYDIVQRIKKTERKRKAPTQNGPAPKVKKAKLHENILSMMKRQNDQFMLMHKHLAAINAETSQTLEWMGGILVKNGERILEQLRKAGGTPPSNVSSSSGSSGAAQGTNLLSQVQPNEYNGHIPINPGTTFFNNVSPFAQLKARFAQRGEILDSNAGQTDIAIQKKQWEAKLSKRYKLKTLRDLWDEYVVGIDGNKPARLFTSKERGRDKAMYCRRKKFWNVVIKMMELGYSADGAIAKIQALYGRKLSVTEILNRLVKDKQVYKDSGGFHPDLKIPCTAEENMALEKKNQKATLATGIRTLRKLWDEYDVGLNGSIPAKDFLPSERGAVKAVYSFRKVFWDLMEHMIALGYSPDEAIAKIKDVYGRNITLSPLLHQLRKDRKLYPNGIHPLLAEKG